MILAYSLAKHVPKREKWLRKVFCYVILAQVSRVFRIFAAEENQKRQLDMKRAVFSVLTALFFLTVSAQESGSGYIVKTNSVPKAGGADAAVENGAQAKKAMDFISKYFKYYSLCDWKEGMKFMVVPEKYDMVVKTFHDASTGKEVSNMPLRHKIMIYKGHSESSDGRTHINFLCQDDNKRYYYELPSGSFDDYCYNRRGVPTLAYLGDVDTARVKLMDKYLFTKATKYRIDTDYDAEGYEEVDVPLNEVVKVVKVGVGTRSFPVKIIVEDENGREFYQNVAISKTNSGVRDDDFTKDNATFLFSGSFELVDELMEVSRNLTQYIGKMVYTKYATDMVSKGDGKERVLRVPRLSTFTIENFVPKNNSQYVTLALKDVETRRIYFKDVTFANADNLTGDSDIPQEDYFGYLFAMGTGKIRTTSQAARAAINQGRVILNMTEDEVTMAVGEPHRTIDGSNGYHEWIYNRSNGKLLVVRFDGTGKVIGTNVDRSGTKPARRSNSTAKKKK